jgi:hypothetical protein
MGRGKESRQGYDVVNYTWYFNLRIKSTIILCIFVRNFFGDALSIIIA